ncbi:MAG: hypothetical protein K9M11_03660 [Candidatus Pacebacteria bacterium]|nr:hypothetical protein [Candidatus Paceibacterota bacterium]
MKSYKKVSISLKKAVVSLTIAGLLVLQIPGTAFGQENSDNQLNRIQSNLSSKSDAQATAADGDTSGVSGGSGGSGAAVSDALGCSAASLLGQAVAMGLKSLASKAVGKVTSMFTTVPISANAVGDNIDKSANANEADASVNAVQQIFGIPFGASFNGIAYCIVNGLITYIADSTIAWANSGFQGNPAFLENPESFFTTLADKQVSQFISSVAYNSTGVNVCEPFRVDLAIALSESYGGQGGTGNISCSMDQIGQNFANFANGGQGGGANVNGYWSNWNQMRQDQNNPWGAYIEAGDYMRGQVSIKNNTAKFELGLNNGFLNFKKCEDKEAAKKGDTSSCKTYTPGSLIESSLNKTLSLGKERLVAAGKIDQVITAVANALVKKALNTVLEQGQ